MPHLVVHSREKDLEGREAELTDALTAAVVAVYGEWARDLVDIRLVVADAPATAITFGIRQAALDRPDADELVRRLTASLTDAVGTIFGAAGRPGVTVEFVATPDPVS